MPTLNLPQPADSLLYPYTVEVWRETLHLGTDGQPATPPLTWARVAAAQACYARLTPNQTAAEGFLQAEDDNFFSMDEFRFPAAADLQATDVFRLTGYPNAALVGNYWRARGNPENHDFIAGYQVVRAKATIKPDGLNP